MLSVAAVPTVTYHWVDVESYWTGCPTSPTNLSLTLLSTISDPPKLLIVSAFPSTASLADVAILIWSAFKLFVIA